MRLTRSSADADKPARHV